MVTFGSETDMLPISVEGLLVYYCDSYIYLELLLTADGLTFSAIKAHAKDKVTHFNKFASFLHKNNDIPCNAKKSVRCHGIIYSLIWMEVVAEC